MEKSLRLLGRSTCHSSAGERVPTHEAVIRHRPLSGRELCSGQCEPFHPVTMRHVLFDLLNELDAAHVHYVLSRHQPDSVMATITLVGERLEAVVFGDGQVYLSRFKGTEAAEGGIDLLRRLVRQNTG